MLQGAGTGTGRSGEGHRARGCTATGSVIELNGHSTAQRRPSEQCNAMCVRVWVNVNPLLHSSSRSSSKKEREALRKNAMRKFKQQPEKRPNGRGVRKSKEREREK